MLNFYEMDQLLAQSKGEVNYDENIANILKKKAQKAAIQQPLAEPAAQAAAPAAPVAAAPAVEPAVEPAAAPAKRGRKGGKPLPGRAFKPDVAGNTANIIPHANVPDLGAEAGPNADPQGLAGRSHRTRDLDKTGGTTKGKQGANLGDSLSTLNSMIKSSSTYRFAAQHVMQKLNIPGVPPLGQDFVIVQKAGMVPQAGVAGVSASEDRSGVPQVVIEDPALLKKVIDQTTRLYSMPREEMPREFSLLQRMASNAIVQDPTGGKNWSVNPKQAHVLQRAVDFYRHLDKLSQNPEVTQTSMTLNQMAQELGEVSGDKSHQLGSDELEIQHGVPEKQGANDAIDNVEALVMLVKADKAGGYGLFKVQGPVGPSALITIMPPQRDRSYDPSLSNKPVAAQAGAASAARQAMAARKAKMTQQGPPVESFQGSNDWSDLTTMMEHWGF